MKPETIVRQLVELLGSSKVSCETQVLTQHSHDYWMLDLQRRVHGVENPLPLAVVSPQTEAEVSAVLSFANRQKLAVVPYGGGSGVCGAARPHKGSLVMDTRAMNSVVRLNETALTVSVQPGHMGDKLEAWLRERGYSMGHYPQSIKLSTVGGWVATRASGQYSTKYGSIENMLVCLRAVLADGTVVSTADVPRAAAGPSVNEILLGSEGTLAVFTELTFKIHPLPEAEQACAFQFATMRRGLEAIRQCLRAGWRPALARLYDAQDAERHFPGVVEPGTCLLFLLSEGPAALPPVELAACKEISLRAGGKDLGAKPVMAWKERRFHVPDLTALATEKGVVFDTIEVAANWDRVADLYDDAIARLSEQVPGLVTAYAHSSHSYQQGTCLYFTFAAKKPNWLVKQVVQKVTRGRAGKFGSRAQLAEIEKLYQAGWQAVMEATIANGGTISHHHGIGKVRLPWVDAELGTSRQVLERLKQALDPHGILNPGTLLGSGK